MSLFAVAGAETPFHHDLAEQLHGRFQFHAGIEIGRKERPGCRQLRFGNAGVPRHVALGVEEMQLKLLDELPAPEVRVRRNRLSRLGRF